jgi:hypothetical protein
VSEGVLAKAEATLGGVSRGYYCLPWPAYGLARLRARVLALRPRWGAYPSSLLACYDLESIGIAAKHYRWVYSSDAIRLCAEVSPLSLDSCLVGLVGRALAALPGLMALTAVKAGTLSLGQIFVEYSPAQYPQRSLRPHNVWV